LIRPLFYAGGPTRDRPLKNALVALGSAAFRHFLGLQLLEAIETRL